MTLSMAHKLEGVLKLLCSSCMKGGPSTCCTAIVHPNVPTIPWKGCRLQRHVSCIQDNGLPLPPAPVLLCKRSTGSPFTDQPSPDSILDLDRGAGPAKRPRVELDAAVLASQSQLRATVEEECAKVCESA